MAEHIALNENGRPIGENHHKATLSDEQVNRIRDLREDHGLTYDQLAAMYSVPKATIQSICQYRTRAQTPFGWKKLEGN
jgi:ribosome-binding protein aMBF1 (putative translation factor)